MKKRYLYVIEEQYEGDQWPLYATEGAISRYKKRLYPKLKELRGEFSVGDERFVIIKYKAEK